MDGHLAGVLYFQFETRKPAFTNTSGGVLGAQLADKARNTKCFHCNLCSSWGPCFSLLLNVEFCFSGQAWQKVDMLWLKLKWYVKKKKKKCCTQVCLWDKPDFRDQNGSLWLTVVPVWVCSRKCIFVIITMCWMCQNVLLSLKLKSWLSWKTFYWTMCFVIRQLTYEQTFLGKEDKDIWPFGTLFFECAFSSVTIKGFGCGTQESPLKLCTSCFRSDTMRIIQLKPCCALTSQLK